jgi:hypothetical protein
MDARRFLIMVLGAAWLLAWGLSIASFWIAEPPAGSVVGEKQVSNFLGWQAIACVMALAFWGVGRAWPKGSGGRRLAGIPLAASAILALAMGAAFFWTTS